jgi:hypothetical protein
VAADVSQACLLAAESGERSCHRRGQQLFDVSLRNSASGTRSLQARNAEAQTQSTIWEGNRNRAVKAKPLFTANKKKGQKAACRIADTSIRARSIIESTATARKIGTGKLGEKYFFLVTFAQHNCQTF